MTTAALNPAIPRARPAWRRSVAAVAAGLVANAALSTATDLALVGVGVFPTLSDFRSFTDPLLLLALAYRTSYGVFGCWLTARLAPSRPMKHSLILGSIGFAIGTVGAIATWGEWTSWYSLAIIAVTLPSALLGARIARRS